MATINQEFQSAPMGRRIYYTKVGIVAVAVAVGVFQAAIGMGAWKIGVLTWKMGSAEAARRSLIGLMFSLLFAIPVFYYERSRVARFSIENNVLVFGKKRYPLEGLIEAARDPDVLRRAVRTFGNGGLGSIRGHFWSKRVGKFEAFLTGTENAVVLRWPNRVVAVSPADTEFFITCAKSAAGIR